MLTIPNSDRAYLRTSIKEVLVLSTVIRHKLKSLQPIN